MYARMHLGTARAGMADQARKMYETYVPRIQASYPACKQAYSLEDGDRFIRLTFWSDRAQMEQYARSDLAREAAAALAQYVAEQSVQMWEVRSPIPPIPGWS